MNSYRQSKKLDVIAKIRSDTHLKFIMKTVSCRDTYS